MGILRGDEKEKILVFERHFRPWPFTRGNGSGRLATACVVGILKGDKKKRIGSRKHLLNRELYVKSRKRELLINILLNTSTHPAPNNLTYLPYECACVIRRTHYIYISHFQSSSSSILIVWKVVRFQSIWSQSQTFRLASSLATVLWNSGQRITKTACGWRRMNLQF